MCIIQTLLRNFVYELLCHVPKCCVVFVFSPVGGVDEGVSPCVQKAFASMLGEDNEEMEDEDDGDAEWKDIGEHYAGDNEVTPGDVFALEMELNRENKKMMKVRLNVLLKKKNSSSIAFF